MALRAHGRNAWFWCGRRAGLSILLATAVSACHAAPDRPSGPQHASATGHTLVSGSLKYRQCVQQAGENAQVADRCLAEEVAYRERTLQTLYSQKLGASTGADREQLEHAQQAWRQQTDAACGTSTRAAADVCRFNRIDARFRELNHRVAGGQDAQWSNVQPDAHGMFEMRWNEVVIAVRSSGCAVVRGQRLCRDATLEVAMPQVTQTLRVSALLLPSAGSDGAPATGFRGTLAGGLVEGRPALVVTDINGDGHDDLLVWTGTDGSYGDPSYGYYLYDPAVGAFVESTALAELVKGHSLSRIVDGQLHVWYRSGPCDRGEKVIDARASAPEIIHSTDVSTCSGLR